MNRLLALLLTLAVANTQSKSLARQITYDEVCFRNGKSAKCMVNKGMMIPLSQGSDIDILWADGRKTTIKLLDNYWGEGGRVLLDGQIRGRITDSILNRGVIHKVISTDDGSTLIFAYGD